MTIHGWIRYVRAGSDNTRMDKLRDGSDNTRMDKIRGDSDNTKMDKIRSGSDNTRMDKVMKDNRLTPGTGTGMIAIIYDTGTVKVG